MGYQIINSPDSSVKWANTPIAFKLESFNWDTYNDYYWTVTVSKETSPGSGTFDTVTERIVRPGPDGFVSLNISPVMAGFVEAVEPDFEDDEWIAVCDAQILRYSFTVIEYTDGTGGSPLTGFGYMYRGAGKANRSFDGGNANVFGTGNGAEVLTDCPSGKRVFPGQPEFLRAPVFVSGADVSSRVKVDVVYQDDTTASFLSAVPILLNPIDIVGFNAGYNLLPNLLNTVTSQTDALSKPVKSWSVYIIADGLTNAPLTEPFTYILEDCDYSPYLRYIVWENEKGGWDTKAVMGEMNMTEAVSKRVVNAIIDPNDFGTARNIISYGAETGQTFEFHTGWMEDEEAGWVKGLLRSHNVYLMSGDHHPNDDPQGARTPITIDSSEVEIHRDSEFLRAITFTASLAIPQPGL